MGNKEFSVDDFDWTVKLISEGSETQNAEKELLELRDKYYEEMAKAVALPKRFLMTP